MPRDRATTPLPPSDLDAWLSAFEAELERLRPHTSLKLRIGIGRAEYLPDLDPKKAAVAYHARLEPRLPAKRAGKRR